MRYTYRHLSVDQHGQHHMFTLIGVNDAARACAVRDWLREKMPQNPRGPISEGLYSHSEDSFRRVWIRDDNDAIEFRLRWC